MTDYQTFEHDVLVIGAGGAGLRAAIAASGAGVSVGLVCKSLLGKAHTVMAEGGIAAAMGNVDDRDSWQVHFADTMRGGQYVNNWRMAELHAKEAPDRVRELEAWGALFDRTAGRPNSPAQLRGPQVSPTGPCGRPHRPGDDPNAAGPRHPPGRRCPDGVHRGPPAHQRRAHRRRAWLRSRAGTVPAVPLQGHRPRDRRDRPGVRDHQQQLGVHRGRPGARLSCRGGTTGHGVRPVPSDGDDLAAERPRDPGDGGRTRRRRRPPQQRGAAVHVRRHPGELPGPDRRQRGGGLALHPGR